MLLTKYLFFNFCIYFIHLFITYFNFDFCILSLHYNFQLFLWIECDWRKILFSFRVIKSYFSKLSGCGSCNGFTLCTTASPRK